MLVLKMIFKVLTLFSFNVVGLGNYKWKKSRNSFKFKFARHVTYICCHGNAIKIFMGKIDIALINNIYMVVQHKLIVVHHQGISQDSLLKNKQI